MGDLILEAAVLGLVFLYLLRKQKLKSDLFNHVSWCVVENKYNEHISSRHLLDQVCHIRWNSAETSSIGDKYYIGRDEEDYALDILDAYRSHLTEAYFKDSLKTEYATMLRDEYFMLSLCGYLETYVYRTTFNENTMYRPLEKTNCDTAWERPYELTPYGVAFNKLLYITSTYCENNKHINKKQAMLRRSNDIRDRLDSNRITM